MRKRLPLLPALWLLALLIAPVVAWLAGVRQPLLTNEPKREFPALNRSSLRDEATFRRIDEALLDRLPFRREAVNAHAAIAIDAFRDSPNPEIAIGPGGWLYYEQELAPCSSADAIAQTEPALDALDIFAGALTAGGYRSTITIVAGKQFVRDRDLASFDEEQEECMRRLRDRVDDRLEHLPGGLPLNDSLRQLEASDDPTFLRTDTHWNWRGRELFLSRILDRIRPGLAGDIGLRVGVPFEERTDLHAVMGLFDRSETDRGVGAERTPDPPLEPGSVFLLGDSQLSRVMTRSSPALQPMLAALAGQTFCTWGEMLSDVCDRQLADADVVVAEKVLKELTTLPAQCIHPVAVAGERAIGSPARYERADGVPQPRPDALTFPAAGAATVRIDAPSRDRDSVPRLVKLPVERLGTNPDGTPAQVVTSAAAAGPCSTLTVGAAGRSLIATLAAGDRLSDLQLNMQAPAGTRLGPPQVVRLDGTDTTAGTTGREG